MIPTKHPKRIARRSKKRAAQERQYLKERLNYLEANDVCEVCGVLPPTDIHHRAGRIGERITDKSLFLAVCRGCHQRIEMNPIWAKEHGYSLSRN